MWRSVRIYAPKMTAPTGQTTDKMSTEQAEKAHQRLMHLACLEGNTMFAMWICKLLLDRNVPNVEVCLLFFLKKKTFTPKWSEWHAAISNGDCGASDPCSFKVDRPHARQQGVPARFNPTHASRPLAVISGLPVESAGCSRRPAAQPRSQCPSQPQSTQNLDAPPNQRRSRTGQPGFVAVGRCPVGWQYPHLQLAAFVRRRSAATGQIAHCTATSYIFFQEDPSVFAVLEGRPRSCCLLGLAEIKLVRVCKCGIYIF